jgi:GxxExxY protein
MGATATLRHSDVTEKIIGIFYDVYNELGYGFLECVYEESLVIALYEAELTANRQIPLPVWFAVTKSVNSVPTCWSNIVCCLN